MLTLRDKHERRQFTLTVELDPPKSASPIKTQKEAMQLIDWADAVNIADCPMAKLRMSPIALAHIIQTDFHLERSSISPAGTGISSACRRSFWGPPPWACTTS